MKRAAAIILALVLSAVAVTHAINTKQTAVTSKQSVLVWTGHVDGDSLQIRNAGAGGRQVWAIAPTDITSTLHVLSTR
jgi:hypothetical protein